MATDTSYHGPRRGTVRRSLSTGAGYRGLRTLARHLDQARAEAAEAHPQAMS